MNTIKLNTIGTPCKAGGGGNSGGGGNLSEYYLFLLPEDICGKMDNEEPLSVDEINLLDEQLFEIGNKAVMTGGFVWSPLEVQKKREDIIKLSVQQASILSGDVVSGTILEYTREGDLYYPNYRFIE